MNFLGVGLGSIDKWKPYPCQSLYHVSLHFKSRAGEPGGALPMSGSAVRRHQLLVSPSLKAQVGDHKLRNVVPERVARIDIEPRVVSCVDSAQASLGRNIAVAGIARNDAWQNVGGDADLILVPEEGGQYGRSSRANRAVGAWIRGIRCSDGQRRPIRVANCCRIPVGVGQADGRDRPPEQVVVLGVIEGDGAVSERQVEHREQARGGLQVGVVRQGGVLGDLIPGVPDRPPQNFAITVWSGVRVVLVF